MEKKFCEETDKGQVFISLVFNSTEKKINVLSRVLQFLCMTSSFILIAVLEALISKLCNALLLYVSDSSFRC